jgi:hypothetical protein
VLSSFKTSIQEKATDLLSKPTNLIHRLLGKEKFVSFFPTYAYRSTDPTTGGAVWSYSLKGVSYERDMKVRQKMLEFGLRQICPKKFYGTVKSRVNLLATSYESFELNNLTLCTVSDPEATCQAGLKSTEARDLSGFFEEKYKLETTKGDGAEFAVRLATDDVGKTKEQGGLIKLAENKGYAIISDVDVSCLLVGCRSQELICFHPLGHSQRYRYSGPQGCTFKECALS